MAATASTSRAQSHVVGVVLLLGLTAVAMGGLTATIGSMMADQTASADAARVTEDLDSAVRPVETTGYRSGTVTFASGRLGTEHRQLRVLTNGSVVATIRTDAVVFETGDHRVAAVAGAIVRSHGESSWLTESPLVTSGPDVLVVGAQQIDGSSSVGGSGGVSVPLRTNVSHERQSLGRGTFQVAIETTTPGAFDASGKRLGAATTVRDIDGDGIPSVVLSFTGTREGYLVVHEMRLEVGHG